ncbi:MAG: hypothetical protein ACRCXL_13460, partial [Dermatophilaceae bacterium]
MERRRAAGWTGGGILDVGNADMTRKTVSIASNGNTMTAMQGMRVVLAEDSVLLRQGLVALL